MGVTLFSAIYYKYHFSHNGSYISIDKIAYITTVNNGSIHYLYAPIGVGHLPKNEMRYISALLIRY